MKNSKNFIYVLFIYFEMKCNKKEYKYNTFKLLIIITL